MEFEYVIFGDICGMLTGLSLEEEIGDYMDTWSMAHTCYVDLNTENEAILDGLRELLEDESRNGRHVVFEEDEPYPLGRGNNNWCVGVLFVGVDGLTGAPIRMMVRREKGGSAVGDTCHIEVGADVLPVREESGLPVRTVRRHELAALLRAVETVLGKFSHTPNPAEDRPQPRRYDGV